MAYRGIGTPFLDCPSCGVRIALRHVNEWEFMGFIERLLFLLGALFSVLSFGAFPGFMVGYFIHEWISPEGTPVTPKDVTYWSVLALVGALIVIWRLVATVRDSIERTQDAAYRAEVKRFVQEVAPRRIGDEEIWQLFVWAVLLGSGVWFLVVLGPW